MAAEGETKPVVAEEAEKKAEQAPAATENATAEAKPAEEAKVEATEAAPAEEKKKPEPKPNVHKQDFEKDVIYLYQFSRTPLLPSLSPYCLKVETFLRLAGLKYENVDHKTKFRSKKGQLPFIELNGEEIADSAIIIKELSNKFEKDLDAGLTPEQKLVAHATISMIENHLVFVIAHWRAKHPDLVLKGYKLNLQHALGTKVPNGILNFIFKIHFGRKLAKKVKAQGLGVHTTEEIEEFGKQDLKVLSDLLADKPFFFGDEPTTLDIVAFSVLAQINYLAEDVKYSLRDYLVENCQNLVGHVSRIKERSFSDWDEICNTLDLNAHLPKPEPEKKENKEGDNTEKIAEQDKNESELEKDKDKSDEKTEKTENKDKEEAK